MAKFSPTSIVRRLQKSAGEQTFCELNGQNIAKMKIDRNKSNTPAQQRQRLAWKEVTELERVFDEASRLGFPSRPRRMTPANAFVQANMSAVTVSDTLEVAINYTKIVCAHGRLKTPLVSVTIDTEQRTLVFTCQTERYGSRRKSTDLLYAFIVEKDLQEGELLPLGTRENNEPETFSLPEDWSAEALAVYVFALSEDKRTASDSKFVPVGKAVE